MRTTLLSLPPFHTDPRLPQAAWPRTRLAALFTAIGTLLGPVSAAAQAVPATTLPTGSLLRAGDATVSTNNATATQTITQTTPRAVIDWQGFSIGQGASVQVTQPTSQSILLNRVIGNGHGPDMSYIEGTLGANGRVFLLNTAGILFGADARVSVGGLLASTLDLVNGNLKATTDAFLTANTLNLAGGTPAPVFVMPASGTQPQIQVGAGGEVLLIGNSALTGDRVALGVGHDSLLLGSVTLGGSIAAQAGRVHLAAGDSATVRLPVGDSGFVSLASIGAAARPVGIVTGPDSVIVNPGGSVKLEAVSQPTLGDLWFPTTTLPSEGTSAGVPAGFSAIFAGGTITARNQVALPSARIELRSEGAQSYIVASGTLDASGAGAGLSGGSISVSAQNISLMSSGTPGSAVRLDASGAAGGGNITLGGTATRMLQIADGAELHANADAAGDGGSIRAEASYFNPVQPGTPVAGVDFGVASLGGRYEASGSGSGHHGGTIATSGAALNIGGARVDASGRNGATPGQWTIDPYDVTISNAASTAVNDFTPTAAGANIRAADIGHALDSGTSVWIGTGSGGPAGSGTITVEAGVAVQRSAGTAPVSLTLEAANSVVLRGGSQIASSAGPLNLTIIADSDGSGFGGIRATEGSTRIVTQGGNVVFGGGADPGLGFARGSAVYDAGIDLAGVTIDTRGAGGAGDLSLRGMGYIGSGYDTPGVRLMRTDITAHDVGIFGRSGNSAAVEIGAGSRIATDSGSLDLRGVSDPGAIGAGAGSIGIEVGQGAQLLPGSGSLRLAGRGGAGGVVLGDVLIGSADNAGIRIVIAGEALGGTAAGVRFDSSDGGPEIRGASGVDAFSGADIVIGASANAAAPRALGLGSGVPPLIRTHGHLNLRPLGVDADGNLTEAAATPIHIGDNPVFGAAPPTNFIVASAWLAPAGANPGVTADAGIVIGSSLQSGRITLQNTAPVGNAALRLSLQNEGVGSAGIALDAPLAADTLGLLSSGDIAQTAAITARQLLVRAGAASTVDLSNPANRIAAVGFEAPRSLRLRTQGNLTVGGVAAAAFDAASAQFTTVAPGASRAGERALLQSLDADLTLAQPIAMTAPNAQLDLVAAGLFRNPSGATLTVGAGGGWRIWSQTWEGSERGGLTGTAPAANLYGCAFGDVASCSLSGAPIPTAGNRFLYRSQPTLTVTADSQSSLWGQPVPVLSHSAIGLVNADPLAEILSGAAGSTATSTSPAREYPIDAGTLAAHNGYRLIFIPGTLSISAPPIVSDGIERRLNFATLIERQHSDVYGLGFWLPNVCTPSSALRDQNATAQPGAMPLAIEWARVRNQPQLTSCLSEREAAECAGF